MPDMEVSFDHEEFDALLNRAKDLVEDGVADAGIVDETGLDPDTVAMLRDEEAEEAAFQKEQNADIDAASRMNRETDDAGERSAAEIDQIEDGIKQPASGGTSPDTADTRLSAAGGSPSDASAQQQAAWQQAMQQQQAQAQQQAQQQQQSMIQQQLSAQQQAAWQQAMQQQQAQAQMAQMNQMGQQQAVQQVSGMDDSVSDAEIRAAIDELFADDSTHSEGSSTGEIASGTEVDTDDLGGAENVSFEKTYPDGAMSEDEIRSAVNQAADAAGVSDDPEVRQKFENLYMRLTEHESGHNPGAANGWDSNAIGPEQSDGFPAQSSRGLAQTIPSTFAANHVAGTSNSIYDPVASIAASMNYLSNHETYAVDLKTGEGLEEFGAARGVDVSSGDTAGAWVGY